MLSTRSLLSAPALLIQWSPCNGREFNTTISLQCGTLPVPLDYTQPDPGKSFHLEIVKIPAPVQPSRGSIQLNFGGPGSPTRADAVVLGPLLQQGTGKSIPFICTDDSYYIGQILSQVRSGNDSDNALRRLWERAKADNYICQRLGKGNDTAEFIGTAFVARDLISVVDALGEDGMLRYWGFSYGTTLGATVAVMFPERVDKVILDGVQNPHDYYHSPADFEEWTDTDKVFSYYFTSCVEAGPEKCALAALNKTAAALEQDVWDFFDNIRAAPIAVGSDVLDLVGLKGFVIEQLKVSAAWSSLSQLLLALIYGSERELFLEKLANALSAGSPGGPANIIPVQSLWGIHCGDTIPRAKSFDEAVIAANKLSKISRLIGDVVTWNMAHCNQWPWHAKETYMGNFHVKTKNPILIASNSRDAHTPLKSALNVSSGFEGSGLLEVNGTGHAALNVPSVCSFKAMVAYWVNGTLPSAGSVCEAPHPFDGFTWADVFQEAIGSNLTRLAQRQGVFRRWLH
ncbi:TAP-like protein-domain-containing protein [Lasiosphaeris hirsuta]|uniref:TAP-like protein-domain-containing protein n=1 Tax=Lasiosphaeris hirsuta TaxID=260670 RepID=A0AA40AIC8_9PEZI|nr:TAP-like protein-domain-containing protein [Lasiosphaeris hirsuta]